MKIALIKNLGNTSRKWVDYRIMGDNGDCYGFVIKDENGVKLDADGSVYSIEELEAIIRAMKECEKEIV